MMKKVTILFSIAMLAYISTWAQKVTTFTTTETSSWVKGKTTLSTKAVSQVVAEVNAQSHGVKFHGFGTTFNELDWDAFNMITREEQDELMYRLFDPQGDLRFTRGRVSMNAGDIAEQLYVSKRTIESQLFTSRKQVRTMMQTIAI